MPRRGEYCRVIATEFNRIAWHLLTVGLMGMDIGAMTPFLHAFREREMINDLIEELCGARLTFNYMRIGGVAWDLPPGWREKASPTSTISIRFSRSTTTCSPTTRFVSSAWPTSRR